MKETRNLVVVLAVAIATLLGLSSAFARRSKTTVNPDDPTYQLYQLLNNSYGGKLKDFYLLANVHDNPQKPGSQLQRVLRVDYDETYFFGRLRIQVRNVDKLTPAQLKTYDAKQIYHFAGQDEEEFEKIDPGPLGQKGDLYLKATSAGPLAPSPLTAEVSSQYDSLITKYIIPALKK